MTKMNLPGALQGKQAEYDLFQCHEMERLLLKSSQLPYPMNYLRYHSPVLAVVTVKVLENSNIGRLMMGSV